MDEHTHLTSHSFLSPRLALFLHCSFSSSICKIKKKQTNYCHSRENKENLLVAFSHVIPHMKILERYSVVMLRGS